MDSGLGYLYLGMFVFAVFLVVGFSLSLAITAHDFFVWLMKRNSQDTKKVP